MTSETLQQTESYSVTVDHARYMQPMVEAGHYDWVTAEITPEHFPATGQGVEQVALELIHFKRRISTDNALAELAALGYHPADLSHLLSFGETYAEIQRLFPVVALGSVWRASSEDRAYPYVSGDEDERGLGLRWCQDDWGPDCRFAAVGKRTN